MMSLSYHIVEFMGRIQIASIFPLQSEKYLNNKMSDKIKKLVKTLVTFNNSSYLMMISIMVKEGSGTIRHLGSSILNFQKVFNFT